MNTLYDSSILNILSQYGSNTRRSNISLHTLHASPCTCCMWNLCQGILTKVANGEKAKTCNGAATVLHTANSARTRGSETLPTRGRVLGASGSRPRSPLSRFKVLHRTHVVPRAPTTSGQITGMEAHRSTTFATTHSRPTGRSQLNYRLRNPEAGAQRARSVKLKARIPSCELI
jgi:hypothetical protein